MYGTTGTQQVGFQNTGSAATLWSGTPESAISLTPFSVPGLTNAEAYAIAWDQQVGSAFINGEDRAALWRGSAATYVNLHPSTAVRSSARATDGTYQWGGAVFVGPQGQYGRALRWSGSATMTTDFTPAGATFAGINAVAAGVQAGGAVFAGTSPHAVVWQGTPESWTDLHPFPPFGSSMLLGTTGAIHVGWSGVPGFSSPQAGVWFGTPESFIRLSAFLPPGFGGESAATCVIEDGGRYIVGGYADGPNGQHQAVIWTIDVPAPGAITQIALVAIFVRRRRRLRAALATRGG